MDSSNRDKQSNKMLVEFVRACLTFSLLSRPL
jgi:hypothetical protein